MPLKAFFPTVFNLLLLIVRVFSFLQFLKAFLPMVFSPVPTVTVFKFVQPSKALSPILVMVDAIGFYRGYFVFYSFVGNGLGNGNCFFLFIGGSCIFHCQVVYLIVCYFVFCSGIFFRK